MLQKRDDAECNDSCDKFHCVGQHLREALRVGDLHSVAALRHLARETEQPRVDSAQLRQHAAAGLPLARLLQHEQQLELAVLAARYRLLPGKLTLLVAIT